MRWHGTELIMVGRKLHSETSKTKELLQVQPDFQFLCFESPTV